MRMRVSDLVAVLEELAPTTDAEPWDNVGLLVGDPAREVCRVLLTIDYTDAVAEEAYATPCDMVIAYHPPIFQGLKHVTAPGLIFEAVRRGVAIYSPHTAFDVAEGGTNDVLGDLLGMTDRLPLRAAPAKDAYYKLVTFVPESAVEAVSAALFAAGAGQIGKYSACSFRAPGTGTFFGESGSNPAVGIAGALATVAELRLETRLPIARVEDALRALRETHPYEEPAFDLIRLAPSPSRRGMGRIGALAPVGRGELFARIKAGLGLAHLLVAGPTTGTVTRVAVSAGSCGDLYQDAIAKKAELYLTGEMRHHDALACARAGLTVVSTLHSNSERTALGGLEQSLRARCPGLDVLRSGADRDPFAFA